MNQWNFRTEKPTVYQLVNSIEMRGPTSIDWDPEIIKKVIQWGWYELRELAETCHVSPADLLAEFWDIGNSWLYGKYIPSLLVFGYFAGSKELQLSTWWKNAYSSLEEAQYNASCIKYVPAGWGLLVIEKVKEKREEARRL